MNDKYSDSLSSLAYYGARYYDRVQIGWTQSDPLYRYVPDRDLILPRTANLYSFALNNTNRYVDPDGRSNTATLQTLGDIVKAAGPAVAAIGTVTTVAISSPVVIGTAIAVGVGILASKVVDSGILTKGEELNCGGCELARARALEARELAADNATVGKAMAEGMSARDAKLEQPGTSSSGTSQTEPPPDDPNSKGGRKASKIDRNAFRGQREAYWKAEAKNNPGKYGKEDLAKMKKGKAPTGSDGHPIELHHDGGNPDSPLVPMTRTEHRLDGNYKVNHPD